jgi:neutral ceramidase
MRLSLTIGLWLISLPSLHAAIEAGLATIDITPPVGWRMSGYFYERFSTGTHEPLQAKAIVFRQGDESAALVFCDLIAMPALISGEARQRASSKTGIPSANILIAATHTHTGPLFFGGLRDHFHARAIQETGHDPFERIDYRGILIDRLVSVIVKADKGRVPVELRAGNANISGLSFNRRYHMKDGAVQFNPGKTNQNIVRPAGPIDPELIFLAIQERRSRKLLGGLTSFALHADTVGGTEYGPDFPGYLERSLKRFVGPDFVSCFGNGPCGDINHVDVADPRAQKGEGEAERIGNSLGRQIVDLLPLLKPLQQTRLSVASTEVRVPLQEYSPERIAQARRDMEKIGTRELSFLHQVEAYKVTDLQSRKSKALLLEVQAFRLNRDIAIVGLPGEVFAELGLAIKKGSPFKNTMVIELSNEAIGYVPTEKAFREGSYEIVNSRVKPGGGEMLVEAALRLLKKL